MTGISDGVNSDCIAVAALLATASFISLQFSAIRKCNVDC